MAGPQLIDKQHDTILDDRQFRVRHVHHGKCLVGGRHGQVLDDAFHAHIGTNASDQTKDGRQGECDQHTFAPAGHSGAAEDHWFLFVLGRINSFDIDAF